MYFFCLKSCCYKQIEEKNYKIIKKKDIIIEKVFKINKLKKHHQNKQTTK